MGLRYADDLSRKKFDVCRQGIKSMDKVLRDIEDGRLHADALPKEIPADIAGQGYDKAKRVEIQLPGETGKKAAMEFLDTEGRFYYLVPDVQEDRPGWKIYAQDSMEDEIYYVGSYQRKRKR